MEDSQQNSMTDRDRKMRESFETFDDSIDRREKRGKIGLPKRSLFFGESKAPEAPAVAEPPSNAEWLNRQNSRAEWRQGLLRSIMIENAEAARRVQDETRVESVDDDKASKKQPSTKNPDKDKPSKAAASDKADNESVSADAAKKQLEAVAVDEAEALAKELDDVSTPEEIQEQADKPVPVQETKKQEEAVKKPKEEVKSASVASPNIVAAATLNTDPNLAKMNEYYYRRKKTGELLLTGLLGTVFNRRGKGESTEVLSAPAEKMPEKVIETQSASISQENTAQEKKIDAKPIETKGAEADVRTMTMPELLQLAEHIDVGVESLKDMYLQGRIDAVNLRKIVAEHAAGRDFNTLLKRSLQAEEMKHELRNEIKTASTQAPVSVKPLKKSLPLPDTDNSSVSDTQPIEEQPVEVAEPQAEAVSDKQHAEEPVVDLAPEIEPPIYPTVELSARGQNSMPSSSYAQVPQPEQVTEYIRVPTYLAIMIGVATGGMLAAVILFFIF